MAAVAGAGVKGVLLSLKKGRRDHACRRHTRTRPRYLQHLVILRSYNTARSGGVRLSAAGGAQLCLDVIGLQKVARLAPSSAMAPVVALLCMFAPSLTR